MNDFILNLQRACELAIDLANYLLKKNSWGPPESSRHAFELLIQYDVLTTDLGNELKKMVGFRNLAVHDYGSLNVKVLESIIQRKLDTFSQFAEVLLKLE